MSPWRMMNEWGIPTVYIESLLYRFLRRLEEKGEFIPSVAIAGGICLEDQVFKRSLWVLLISGQSVWAGPVRQQPWSVRRWGIRP